MPADDVRRRFGCMTRFPQVTHTHCNRQSLLGNGRRESPGTEAVDVSEARQVVSESFGFQSAHSGIRAARLGIETTPSGSRQLIQYSIGIETTLSRNRASMSRNPDIANRIGFETTTFGIETAGLGVETARSHGLLIETALLPTPTLHLELALPAHVSPFLLHTVFLWWNKP